jgi:uncharacterized protein (TIGR02594 family)
MMALEEVPWLKGARADLGLQEIPGPRHEARILELADHASLGWINDDETPWCAIGLGGWLAEAKVKPSGSAAARSYLNWGIDVWHKGEDMIPLGAIMVFSRPPKEYTGHVAIATGQTRDGEIICIGANQRNSVSFAKFKPDRIIGARWPIEYRSDLRMSSSQLPFVANFNTSSSNEA